MLPNPLSTHVFLSLATVNVQHSKGVKDQSLDDSNNPYKTQAQILLLSGATEQPFHALLPFHILLPFHTL